MNSKSLAIIAVVAVVVAGVTYCTYILDSDEDLELRDYLVVGDWVEYSFGNNDYTDRYTVIDIERIDRYVVNMSDLYTVTVSYAFLFTILDPDDDGIEYLGTETANTFMGKINCEVYSKYSYGTSYKYYVDPETKLVLITEGVGDDGRTFTSRLTGTSVFNPVNMDYTDITLSEPTAGSAYGYENNYEYVSGDSFYSGGYDASMEVTSVNYDGTLNIVREDEPITVEDFMSGLVMSDEDYDAWTLVGTKVVSTQWGLMECNEYTRSSYDAAVNDAKWGMLTDPETGLILRIWMEDHNLEYEGIVWDDYFESSTLLNCNLVQVIE